MQGVKINRDYALRLISESGAGGLTLSVLARKLGVSRVGAHYVISELLDRYEIVRFQEPARAGITRFRYVEVKTYWRNMEDKLGVSYETWLEENFGINQNDEMPRLNLQMELL